MIYCELRLYKVYGLFYLSEKLMTIKLLLKITPCYGRKTSMMEHAVPERKDEEHETGRTVKRFT